MLTDCRAAPWKRLRDTNATGSYPAENDTLTKPSGSGVLDLTADIFAPNGLELAFFGTGADGATFSARVTGWRPSLDGATWVPTPLGEFDCTISTGAPGVAGGIVGASEYYADTIAAGDAFADNTGVSHEVVSPANNTRGHVLLDAKGCRLFTVRFNLVDATGANALVSPV